MFYARPLNQRTCSLPLPTSLGGPMWCCNRVTALHSSTSPPFLDAPQPASAASAVNSRCRTRCIPWPSSPPLSSASFSSCATHYPISYHKQLHPKPTPATSSIYTPPTNPCLLPLATLPAPPPWPPPCAPPSAPSLARPLTSLQTHSSWSTPSAPAAPPAAPPPPPRDPPPPPPAPQRICQPHAAHGATGSAPTETSARQASVEGCYAVGSQRYGPVQAHVHHRS